MITFKNQGNDYKIYFQYQRKQVRNKFPYIYQKIKTQDIGKDTTICILVNSTEKNILFQSISECSYEDNFSREVGRQITLVRLLNTITYSLLFSNNILEIIKKYFTGRISQLPEKEANLLNDILLNVVINNK
jgi:isopropylmalate/homocitrate/citramalate synthase